MVYVIIHSLQGFDHLCLLACVSSTSSPLKPSVAMANSSAPYLQEERTTATRIGLCARVAEYRVV